MVAYTIPACHNCPMRERDYPKFASSPRDYLPPEQYTYPSNPVHPKSALENRLSEIDEPQAADVRNAIDEAAALHSDVHLYRKRGSQFLCIGFQPSNGPSVKVYEYPEK